MLYRMAFALAFLFVATVTAWPQQPHAEHPQDLELHEKFYDTWKRPNAPYSSCCNLDDCYPTEFKKIDGQWHALRREDHEWVRIPPEVVEENRDSPDGRNHVCMLPPDRGGTMFCAVFGSGA